MFVCLGMKRERSSSWINFQFKPCLAGGVGGAHALLLWLAPPKTVARVEWAESDVCAKPQSWSLHRPVNKSPSEDPRGAFCFRLYWQLICHFRLSEPNDWPRKPPKIYTTPNLEFLDS